MFPLETARAADYCTKRECVEEFDWKYRERAALPLSGRDQERYPNDGDRPAHGRQFQCDRPINRNALRVIGIRNPARLANAAIVGIQAHEIERLLTGIDVDLEGPGRHRQWQRTIRRDNTRCFV